MKAIITQVKMCDKSLKPRYKVGIDCTVFAIRARLNALVQDEGHEAGVFLGPRRNTVLTEGIAVIVEYLNSEAFVVAATLAQHPVSPDPEAMPGVLAWV